MRENLSLILKDDSWGTVFKSLSGEDKNIVVRWHIYWKKFKHNRRESHHDLSGSVLKCRSLHLLIKHRPLLGTERTASAVDRNALS